MPPFAKAIFTAALFAFSTLANAQAPPRPPGPLEPPSPLDACVAKYVEKNYGKRGDAFTLGTLVLGACGGFVDAEVARRIAAQPSYPALEPYFSKAAAAASDEHWKIRVYFQTQEAAAIGIIFRRAAVARAAEAEGRR